jgi:radical SAM protein with 4Fe4S-binding SPASM domain
MTAGGKAFVKRVPSGRAELWKAGRPALARLDIELTERCNNDCLHCSVNLPAGDEGARRREGTAGEIKHILREAASLGCLSVRLTGGEPLLREDFEEIYLAARGLGLKVRVFTNATRVTPRLATLFGKRPPLERVEVSVYGMTAESSAAATRNPGAYEASRRGIGLLVEHGVPFLIKGAILPPTKDEMDRFETWAKATCGADEPPCYAALFDLRSRRDDEVKNAAIRGLRIGPRDYLRLEARRGEAYPRELLRFLSTQAGPQGVRLFPCLADAASVDAYGHFQACLVLRHPATVYDLRNGSLREAVEDFLPKVRETRAANPDYIERCGRCFLKSLCLQCPSKSWAEHGTLDTPVEYFCDIAHAQAVRLGLLEQGEKAWIVEDWEGRVKTATLASNGADKPGGKTHPGCEGETTWPTR